MAQSTIGGMGGSLSDTPPASPSSPGEIDWTSDDGPALSENATHFYFPVEIEVRTEAAGVDQESIVAETLRRLTEGMRSV